MDNSLNIDGLKNLEWSEHDFEHMQWHDSKVYAIAFGIQEHELCFDIDYILEWIHPKADETHFRFIVVPVTLIFRNVYDLNINFSSVEVIVEDILRDNPNRSKNAAYIKEEIEYTWTIETNNGEINFKSVGYKQCARQVPKVLNHQSLNFIERGGISF